MSTRPAGRTRTALVTGVAGQDGVYLARHLRSLGYHVVGTLRPGSRWAPLTLGRAYAYLDGVQLVDLDQRDHEGWAAVLEGLQPDEIYNLAGFSSVGALRMLEELVAFRDRHGWSPRFFQPSSSEMFGTSDQQPQTEGTPHHPRSPYAASKSFAHHLVVNYRESYGLFTATGTLYNHESPLRGEQFVTRKITRSVAEIALGRRDEVVLGNLDVRRDWGFAGDYAVAMQRMLQLDDPQDFIVATGTSRPLAEVVEVAFAAAGLGSPEGYLRQDPALMRPADVADLVGDPTKAREQLDWTPSVSFEQVIEHMVRVDVTRLERGVEDAADYLSPA